MMLRNTVSTITSECFLVRSDTRETSSTSSAFVMLPLVIVLGPLPYALPVPEVIPERGRSVAGGLLVRLPVGAELVRFQRANRQADLPLRRREFDDLHRIALADVQRDLLVLARVMRIVELRDVDQPLDALVELDERAEVR